MDYPSADSTFHAILGRALTDHDYRARLTDQQNPDGQRAALREMGVENPDESIGALNEAIGSLDAFASSFGGSIAAS